MTWRDYQHLIVHSAQPLDLNDPGWITNGAGHRFNHKYGFGVLDAERLLDAATHHDLVPKSVTASFSTASTASSPHQIPLMKANGGEWLRVEVEVASKLGVDGKSVQLPLMLEHVRLTLTLTHPQRRHLTIHLTSPQRTRSILGAGRASDVDTGGFQDWTFMSVFHWGEDPRGTWLLEVKDTRVDLTGTLGTLDKFKLIISGIPCVRSDWQKLDDAVSGSAIAAATNDSQTNGRALFYSQHACSAVHQRNGTDGEWSREDELEGFDGVFVFGFVVSFVLMVAMVVWGWRRWKRFHLPWCQVLVDASFGKSKDNRPDTRQNLHVITGSRVGGRLGTPDDSASRFLQKSALLHPPPSAIPFSPRTPALLVPSDHERFDSVASFEMSKTFSYSPDSPASSVDPAESAYSPLPLNSFSPSANHPLPAQGIKKSRGRIYATVPPSRPPPIITNTLAPPNTDSARIQRPPHSDHARTTPFSPNDSGQMKTPFSTQRYF